MTTATAGTKTALQTAQEYLTASHTKIAKASTALRTTTSMTLTQKTAAVAAFKAVAKRATELKSSVRAEFRAAMHTAADGDEVSDDYGSATDSLSQIINLAETALDQLGDEDGGDAGSDTTDPTAAVATEGTPAVAEEATATEAGAAAEITSGDSAIEADAGADMSDGSDGSDAVAELIADTGISAADFKIPGSKKATLRKADADIIDSIQQGLQNLVDQIKELSGGDSGDGVVNVDENGVVQDAPTVDDQVNEDTTIPSDGDAAPVTDDDDMHAQLEAILSDASAGLTASADPYTQPEHDPLAGKGAKKAAEQRTAAARGRDQHSRDLENLSFIANSLVR